MKRAVTGSFMVQVDGDWRYDARKSIMLWSIDIIDDSNRTGSLEFVVPNTRPESFFPVTVNFNAARTLCQVCCCYWWYFGLGNTSVTAAEVMK